MSKEKTKPEDRPLTKKEAAFVDYLFICGLNGYAAAVKAGYSERSAYVTASQNLRKPNITKAIQERLAEVHLSSDEALAILATHARGDVAQLMDVSGVGFNLDMSKAQALGLTKLIKRVKQKTTIYSAKKESEEDREVTELEIELYDAQSAIDKILKVQGKYVDRHELTGKDGKDLAAPIVQIYIPTNERDGNDT